MECPLCESPKTKSHYSIKGFDVVECRHCSLVYVPTPAPEFSFLRHDSLHIKSPEQISYFNYRAELSSHLLTFKKRLLETEKWIGHKGRLLDVGCALGHLGEAAKRLGWDVYVTDVSEFAVLEARDQFSLNAFISAPDKLPVLENKFDIVTLYNVVELVSHPIDLLKDICRCLRNDGVLHVVTPNIHSWSARFMGRFWFHLNPDHQFNFFTPETLVSLLERCGFEILRVKPVKNTMRVSDIFLRLERYSKFWSAMFSGAARFLGFSDWRIQVYTGEIQVWARPAHPKAEEPLVPIKDILDIVCCTNCQSQMQLFEDDEAICTQCELSYEVTQGVINFSRYAKRRKRRLLGNS